MFEVPNFNGAIVLTKHDQLRLEFSNGFWAVHFVHSYHTTISSCIERSYILNFDLEESIVDLANYESGQTIK